MWASALFAASFIEAMGFGMLGDERLLFCELLRCRERLEAVVSEAGGGLIDFIVYPLSHA